MTLLEGIHATGREAVDALLVAKAGAAWLRTSAGVQTANDGLSEGTDRRGGEQELEVRF
jgi:hypothetical protein